MSYENIPKNALESLILARQGPAEYTKLAAAANPTPTAGEEGVVLLVTDTGSRYIWTGTAWVQSHSLGKLIIEYTQQALPRDTISSAVIATAIATNAATSTVLLASNSTRKFVAISNSHATDAMFIKLQAAAVDNTAKGIYLLAGQTFTLNGDPMYTGEISAIAASGTPNAYVTSY
jgi:hypothetical protein